MPDECKFPGGNEPARILIVDDHPLVREGIAARIARQGDMETCGEAAEVNEALNQVGATRPDLVIIDISLKDGNGIELVKEIKRQYKSIKMLVLSMFDESLYAERALRAGAMGYINKGEDREKVIDAIRQILRGNRYLSPRMTDRMIAQAVDVPKARSSIETLSDRELEVFTLIGQGHSTGAIANILHRSVHTIDTHRERIKSKLKLCNSAELTRHAMLWVINNS